MHVHRWSAWNQSRKGPSAVPSLLSLLGYLLLVVTGWVLARSSCGISSQELLCCQFFNLWILLTWCSMNLREGFSPITFIFSSWVSSSSAPLGTRERRQVWRGWCDLLAILLLSEHEFSCGSSPVLGLSWVLALGAVNSSCPSFIAVNDLGCQWVPLFQPLLCSFSWCFCTHLHSFILHISQYFCHNLYIFTVLMNHKPWMLSLVIQQPSDNSSQKAPFPFITQSYEQPWTHGLFAWASTVTQQSFDTAL